MPAIVQGNPYSARYDLSLVDIAYDYPNNINLKPGSPIHEKIRLAVYNKANESYRVMQKRFPSWNAIDETLTVYMPLDEEEKGVQDKDPRKPVSIVVPYSYAQLETIVTYMVAAFCQDPIFRYEGTGPEDTIGATLLELLVQSQCNRFKMGISLHTMFRDACAYGIGSTAPVWSQIWGKKMVKKENPLMSLFGRFLGNEKTTQAEDSLLYEGNSLTNIDPYRFLPDPHYGIQDIQKGDFVGWLDTTSLMDLMNMERRDPDEYFNIKYLKSLSSRRSTIFHSDDSGRNVHGTTRDRHLISEQYANPVDLTNMIVKIIPREYGLPGDESNPDGEYPEKWHFTLAADQVVVRAKPLGLNHDMFPVACCAPDFDGRTVTPISRLEIINGLQTTLNFMFNSHVANVRKAINDMLVVDPYMINMNDLRDPQPGKLIRLRRSAWGSGGVTTAVQQLKVADVTSNNIADGERIMSIMERVSAATHNMMGIMRPGSERRSAAEFEGTQNSAMNRLERIAKMIGLQAMQDIGYMFASQTQQLMSEKTFIKITGTWEKILRAEYGDQVQNSRLNVSPYDIAVDYDCFVRDGTVPGGNFSQAWVQMFQAIGSSDVLASRIDVFRLFKHIARNLGAKDIEEFELKQGQQQQQQQPTQLPPVNTQVLPDEEVQRQAQAGNLVPMGGM